MGRKSKFTTEEKLAHVLTCIEGDVFKTTISLIEQATEQASDQADEDIKR